MPLAMGFKSKRVVFPLLLLAASWTHAQNQPKASADETKPASSEPQATKTPDSGSPALPDSTGLQLVSGPKPVYPIQAREQKLRGQVVLKLMIAENGDVESTEAVSGPPVFVEAAVDAAKQWKFKPFIRNGRAVKVSMKVPFDFAFQENVTDQPQSKTIDSLPTQTGTNEQKTPMRVRVSQGVAEKSIRRKVTPRYPPDAKHNFIQGTVLLGAVISKDGAIANLHVISGNPILATAAVDAVKQWRYRPYMLNGAPVEVETTISVTFRM